MSFSLTAIGSAKIAQAVANHTSISIAQVVAGSGTQADLRGATALSSQHWQGAPAAVAVGDDAHQVSVHALIPSSAAAFELTELGLLDSAGDLIAYGTLDGIHKPAPDGQIGGEVALRFVLDVGVADRVSLTVDPAAAATLAWVREQLPGPATDTEPGLVELATASEAIAGTDIQRVLTTATGKEMVETLIEQLINNSPAALDTLHELADALGSDPDFATTVTNALAQKAALTHHHAASDITSGIFKIARLPTTNSYHSTSTTAVPRARALRDLFDWVTGQLAGKAASNHSHSQYMAASSVSLFAPNTHHHAASEIDSGTLNIARLPTTNSYNSSSTTAVPSARALRDLLAWVTERLAGKAANDHSHGWGSITGKPNGYTPSTHEHAASDITRGTFSLSRIPPLPASKITSGFISSFRLPVPTSTRRGGHLKDSVSLSTNGYSKNNETGLILQWLTGTARSGAAGSGFLITYSFPIAFPSACLQVLTTSDSNSLTRNPNVFSTYSFTRTQVTVQFNEYDRTNNTTTPRILAIGY